MSIVLLQFEEVKMCLNSKQLTSLVIYHLLEGLHAKMKTNNNGTPTRFGYEIIRDHVLPSILGNNEAEILYWAGKEIARKFPIFTTDELPSFFVEAGWGTLTLEKLSKHEAFYKLTNESYSLKIQERTFHLESGFIAEQYQKVNGVLTECFAEQIHTEEVVRFHVKWDLKTKV
jgi:predicted hydrocarbon binding protein